MLKPQDLLVLLWLVAHRKAWTYAGAAAALRMSSAEVHAALKRAARAGLYAPEERRPIRAALRESLVHGARYAFAPERLGIVRALPTAHAAPALAARLALDAEDLPLVWPHAEGEVRGEGLEPLYPSAPKAARHDPRLYTLLALLDALRVGRARERTPGPGAAREGTCGMSSSRAQLVHVAKRLGPLRERAVFVGSATLELLVTDPGATPIRPTDDVDLVVPARSRLEYRQDLSDELRRAGKNNLRERPHPFASTWPKNFKGSYSTPILWTRCRLTFLVIAHRKPGSRACERSWSASHQSAAESIAADAPRKGR